MHLRCLALSGAVLFAFGAPALAECGEEVTTRCIVEEIRAGLDEETIDPFLHDRIRAALARAQLADGDEAAAVSTSAETERMFDRLDFVTPHARFLRLDGRSEEAVEVLRAGDAVLVEEDARIRAMLYTSHIIRELEAAGDPEGAREILSEVVETLQESPSPMGFEQMLSAARLAGDIGYPDEGAAIARTAFGWFDEGRFELQPMAATYLFDIWVELDASGDAEREASELIDYFADDGPSAFNGAIWAGVAKGLQARGEDAGEALRKAIEALDVAPERDAAAIIELDLTQALSDAGRRDEAIERLESARETIGSFPLQVSGGYLVAITTRLVDIGAEEEARALIDELAALRDGDDEEAASMRFLARPLAAQLVRLGDVDEALAFNEPDQNTVGTIGIVNELVRAGDYERALPLTRNLDGELRYMSMAGIAERIAYGEEAVLGGAR